ncbi:MAG: 5'-nucleotidase C-terminal domain-containing protein [Pseudomonadota bacterium]
MSYIFELLHFSDQEGAPNALTVAPNLSAVLNALRALDAGNDGAPDNSLTLSSGDAIIPGVFFDASEVVWGEDAGGVGDIFIQNALRIDAISLGNHEFDLGTDVLAGLIDGSATDVVIPGIGAFEGTAMPYLGGNLDFSSDENLAPLAVEDGGTGLPATVTGSIFKDVNGEQIGIVSAVTPTLPIISDPGDLGIFPDDFETPPSDQQLDALAAVIQEDVDALLAANPDMNKVILLSHMQQLSIETEIAQRLTNVDIIVAGGSDTILTDENDRVRDGQSSGGEYPIELTDADGNPILVVNTDGQYQYVGRLVIEFDDNGIIVPESYDPGESGAFATDAQGVEDLGAADLVDPTVQAVVDELSEAIIARESNIFGISETFLNGERSGQDDGTDPDGVRTQETNLGNLTADANLTVARDFDDTVMVSIKNGGGIRASIGDLLVPPGGTEAERSPNAEIDGVKPEGGISQTDIQATLAFNNGLSLLTLTREELVEVLEHGISALPDVAGQFPQVAGIEFSFDETKPAGSRIETAAIVDESGEVVDVLVRFGEIVGDPNGEVRIVTLSFLADGGDGYPFPDPESASRVDLFDLDADGEDDNVMTGDADFAADGTEQDALAEYLLDNYSAQTPYDLEDTGRAEDTRIQNKAYREDTVLEGVSLELTPIFEIQGASQVAPIVLKTSGFATVPQFFASLEDEAFILGHEVRTSGIVTAIDSNGFYLQDAVGDGNIATSDAIFVFTDDAPEVIVGDEVEVIGDVSEFFPGDADSGNLPTTQITNVSVLTLVSSENELPDASVIGQSGRVLPSENLEDDAYIVFNPTTSGIDFMESLEGMRVTVEDAAVIGSTNRFGEIFVTANQGADPTGLSERGTLNISPDDFNPERIQIDDDSSVFEMDTPDVNVGDLLDDVTGVLGYSFGNYEIIPTEDYTDQIVSGGLAPEVTDLSGCSNAMTVASYNVLNLDPNDADGDTDVLDFRFVSIAAEIVNNLGSPDVIALQEIQDNSGSADDGTVSASETLETLAQAIDFVDNFQLDGSLSYEWIDNTFIGDNTSGGQPGGNIRTAYLYNTDRVSVVDGSVETISGQAEGQAFFGARLPLVATFEFGGVEVTMVNNHFSSKSGSAPIMGTTQPFESNQENTSVNGSLDERQAQAAAVAGFVAEELAADPQANVVVLGDLNEFEFISPVSGLEAMGLTNLTNSLDEDERYSFNFQGNSQQLDHILASQSLTDNAEFDIVHTNSEFAATAFRASDHDPLLAEFFLGDQLILA